MTNRKRSVCPWIVYPLLAVVLYVISIGPAYAATYAHLLGHPDREWIGEIFAVTYAPVNWIGERSPAFTAAVTWYVGVSLPWVD